MLSDRIELKFLVDTGQRAALLQACAGRLLDDPHSAAGPYRVTSQYYDAPGLTCLWEKLDGVERRKKLRLRFYGDVERAEDLPEGGTFFEVKHRIGRRILKERVGLTVSGCERLLLDVAAVSELSELVPPTELERGLDTLNLIGRLTGPQNYRPANVITYLREAWRGAEEPDLRINFDGALRALPPNEWAQAARGGLPLLPPDCYVFEVKFTRRLASWLRQVLVQEGLRAQSYSKYAEGMLALRGEPSHALRNP